MIILFNPTEETMRTTFGGRNYFLEPDATTEVNDNCGNHILNEYSKRGLCQLKYGDDKDEIAIQGKERNVEFKKGMIVEFNQRNEARKQMGLGYLTPTPYLTGAAVELGLQLYEPYTVKDADRQEVKELKEKNRDLEKKIEQLMDTVNSVLSGMVVTPAGTVKDSDTEQSKKGKK